MTVWDDLVGQQHIVDQLTATVSGADAALRGEAGTGMTHAWLFTGPPGSGRSTAARAFAAALQCERGGCGGQKDQRRPDGRPSGPASQRPNRRSPHCAGF